MHKPDTRLEHPAGGGKVRGSTPLFSTPESLLLQAFFVAVLNEQGYNILLYILQ